MTQDEQNIITERAKTIDGLQRRIRAINDAFARHRDSGVGRYKSLAECAAEVVRQEVSDADARLILTRLHDDAINQLASMPFPTIPPEPSFINAILAPHGCRKI